MAGARRLTLREITMLQRVFGDCVDYRRVRVHDEHWTAAVPGMGAFVIGNHIMLAGKYVGNASILIHETAHVWQFQNDWGWRYFFNALGHHITKIIDKHNPYDYTAVAGRVPWRRWNPEQQAQWIQDHESLPSPEILDPEPRHD